MGTSWRHLHLMITERFPIWQSLECTALYQHHDNLTPPIIEQNQGANHPVFCNLPNVVCSSIFAIVECAWATHGTNLGVSPPNCSVERVLTYNHISRTTNSRILSITIICTFIWLWVRVSVPDIIPPARVVLDDRDQHKPLRPAFVMNTSCENRQLVKATKLSQTLFPVPKTGSWVAENHEMLQALFRCIELSNCGRNQKKGASRIFDLFEF